MTIEQAIHGLDTLHPNPYSLEEKLRWLSAVEGLVYNGIFAEHQNPPAFTAPFTSQTPLTTPLLVPAPYDGLYRHYLEGQMLYAGGEITGYNNAMALFNQYFREFWRYYHASHKPLGASLSVLQ